MKTGFYLRPDGEEIIEIKCYLSSFTNSDIVALHFRGDGYSQLIDDEFDILFGNWIYLGE